MTPQQDKAKELIDKFISIGCLFANAKKCAIIAVGEIIKVLDDISIGESGTTLIDYGQSFWEEVKKEITNL